MSILQQDRFQTWATSNSGCKVLSFYLLIHSLIMVHCKPKRVQLAGICTTKIQVVLDGQSGWFYFCKTIGW